MLTTATVSTFPSPFKEWLREHDVSFSPRYRQCRMQASIVTYSIAARTTEKRHLAVFASLPFSAPLQPLAFHIASPAASSSSSASLRKATASLGTVPSTHISIAKARMTEPRVGSNVRSSEERCARAWLEGAWVSACSLEGRVV